MIKMINEDFFDSVEIDEYEDEIEDIDNIYNSKRFKFIDKIGNIKNKIIKK